MALSIVNLETKGRRGWVGEDTFVDTPAKQTSALSAAQTVTLTENLSWMAPMHSTLPMSPLPTFKT